MDRPIQIKRAGRRDLSRLGQVIKSRHGIVRISGAVE